MYRGYILVEDVSSRTNAAFNDACNKAVEDIAREAYLLICDYCDVLSDDPREILELLP